jgi:hypothetical protein
MFQHLPGNPINSGATDMRAADVYADGNIFLRHGYT